MSLNAGFGTGSTFGDTSPSDFCLVVTKALAFRAAWFTANQRRFNFADAAEDQRAVEFYAELLASLTNPELAKNIKPLCLHKAGRTAGERVVDVEKALGKKRRRSTTVTTANTVAEGRQAKAFCQLRTTFAGAT